MIVTDPAIMAVFRNLLFYKNYGIVKPIVFFPLKKKNKAMVVMLKFQRK